MADKSIAEVSDVQNMGDKLHCVCRVERVKMKHKPVKGKMGSSLLSKHNYQDYLKFLPERVDKIEEYLKGVAKEQCMSLKKWPQIEKIEAWMISSETATFMKVGGLGVVATELPEAFNRVFAPGGDRISVVTPLYTGDTSHKKATLRKNVYTGAENRSVNITKIGEINVPFVGKNRVVRRFSVKVYSADDGRCSYIFLANRRFFTITTDYRNPGCLDGCYVFNKLGVNEVERFAFFSKCVFVLLENILSGKFPQLNVPNILIANDWHSGALAGLCKYLAAYRGAQGRMDKVLADKICNIPIIHLIHHMGYQGWDYENTVKILNSLYEDAVKPILLSAEPCLKNNPRIEKTLVVSDTYNQAGCNLQLADRLVTVSKNYAQEVSKKEFGYDFAELLAQRQKNGNFFGIVNGYDKKLIAPLADKLERINRYFDGTDFRCYSEKDVGVKKHNKKEFIKLISKLAADDGFKQKTLPLVDFYKFDDISSLADKCADIPMFCATSRLVEQKGYDIAAEAIIKFLSACKYREAPIWVLGGAGDARYFEYLIRLKDYVAAKDPEAAKRIFVFRGYKDEFAYVIQLASDFYMMPCRFEPCGLTQMEAMAKGTLPAAMSTGGLVDTIEDGVDGFRTLVFYGENEQVFGTEKDAKKLKNNVDAFADVLKKSTEVFEHEADKLQQMAVRAMEKDFSWDVENGSVYKYYHLFKTGKIA